jgi:hypothetical protein
MTIDCFLDAWTIRLGYQRRNKASRPLIEFYPIKEQEKIQFLRPNGRLEILCGYLTIR